MNATHSYKGFCVVCLTLAVCIVPDKLYLDSSSAHILVFLRIVSSLTASDLDVCAVHRHKAGRAYFSAKPCKPQPERACVLVWP